MTFVDISQGWYDGMPSFDAPWYPEFSSNAVMTPETDPTGVGRTFTEFRLFPHNGTHIESGFHFFQNGKKIDEVPLETFVGPAVIADLSHKQDLDEVTGDDLEKAVGDVWQEGLRLLIRTDHPERHLGEADYWDTAAYLTPSAADWIVEHRAALVGMDCVTEKQGDRTSPIHRRLLEAEIPILENIRNLGRISKREVHLMALPILISGVEAAPARALVFENWAG
jgi:arylformamidase